MGLITMDLEIRPSKVTGGVLREEPRAPVTAAVTVLNHGCHQDGEMATVTQILLEFQAWQGMAVENPLNENSCDYV